MIEYAKSYGRGFEEQPSENSDGIKRKRTKNDKNAAHHIWLLPSFLRTWNGGQNGKYN